MLSSAKQEKRFNEINPKIDKCTKGYKARASATMQKPKAAIVMICDVLATIIPIDYCNDIFNIGLSYALNKLVSIIAD